MPVTGESRYGLAPRRSCGGKGQGVNQSEGSSICVTIPARLNVLLVLLSVCTGMVQLFLVPALLPLSAWWALLLVGVALSTTTNWSLIHESIHRLLHPDARTNDLCGRVLSVLFGSPFESLRFAHLLHHAMNGTAADRPEYVEQPREPGWAVRTIFYPRLLFGIYAAEVAGTLAFLLPVPALRRVLMLLPKHGEGDTRAETHLLCRDRLVWLRIEATATVLLYTAAFILYGSNWALLALSIVARGVIISVSDNSYHYGAPLGSGAGSAYNFSLPLSAVILHFNLHRVHHRHPAVPWTALPATLKADNDRCDMSYAIGMLRQFQGPIASHDYARAPASAPRNSALAWQKRPQCLHAHPATDL